MRDHAARTRQEIGVKMLVWCGALAAACALGTAISAGENPPRNYTDNDIVSEGVASRGPSGPALDGWAAALEIRSPQVRSAPMPFSFEARNDSGSVSFLQYGPFPVRFHGVDVRTGKALLERVQAVFHVSVRGGRAFEPHAAVRRTGDLRDRFVFPSSGRFRIWGEIGLDLSDRAGPAVTTTHTFVQLVSNKVDVTVTQ